MSTTVTSRGILASTEVSSDSRVQHEANNLSSVCCSTPEAEYKSGYDLPVYGLETGEFLTFHVLALSCMAASLLSALAVVIISFKKHNCKAFFSWSKGEKTVVYIALCDGCFNVAHSLDHTHYLLHRDHVKPVWLCQIYGFMLVEFISSQTLLVNIIAISAFMLMYYQKKINFGSRDWKLLVYVFGVPFVAGVFAAVFDQLGPNGAFCYFDTVKGFLANICFTTIPLMLVIVVNSFLYLLTWRRIRQESAKITNTLGNSAATANSSAKAAKTMSLFVAAYFVQTWAASVWGCWQLFERTPPLWIYRLLTTFSNLGGVFNGIVYAIIRYRMKQDKNEHKPPGPTTNMTNINVL